MLWEMPKLLSCRFPETGYFLNCDNTELKRFSKICLSVSERHRLAVVGCVFEGLHTFKINDYNESLPIVRRICDIATKLNSTCIWLAVTSSSVRAPDNHCIGNGYTGMS